MKKSKIAILILGLGLIILFVKGTFPPSGTRGLLQNMNETKYVLHRADSRGKANHGWLKTSFSFSFADYYDKERMNFGALRVLNDDSIAGGHGFDMHPHKNMEIITIPLSGALAHKDNQGGSGIVKAGDIQVMSAGSGVYHSEFNASETETATLLQIWAFPNQNNVKPRYDQKTFDTAERQNRWQKVVAPNDPNALWVHQDLVFSLGEFDKDRSTEYNFQFKGNGVYAFIIEGKVEIDGQELNRRDALGIWNTDKIKLNILEKSNILLMEVPME
jgi:quercetin 2,3-dioxygenase